MLIEKQITVLELTLLTHPGNKGTVIICMNSFPTESGLPRLAAWSQQIKADSVAN